MELQQRMDVVNRLLESWDAAHDGEAVSARATRRAHLDAQIRRIDDAMERLRHRIPGAAAAGTDRDPVAPGQETLRHGLAALEAKRSAFQVALDELGPSEPDPTDIRKALAELIDALRAAPATHPTLIRFYEGRRDALDAHLRHETDVLTARMAAARDFVLRAVERLESSIARPADSERSRAALHAAHQVLQMAAIAVADARRGLKSLGRACADADELARLPDWDHLPLAALAAATTQRQTREDLAESARTARATALWLAELRAAVARLAPPPPTREVEDHPADTRDVDAPARPRA